MPVDGEYNDSGTPDNTQKCDTWQSVGDVADRLKSKCVEAMALGQSEVAETYHQKLVEHEVNANERLVRR